MALITTPTGTYDDSRLYTLAELAGEWWWHGEYAFILAGGHVRWTDCQFTPRGTLRIARLDITDGLRVRTRYPQEETKARLVKLHHAEHDGTIGPTRNGRKVT